MAVYKAKETFGPFVEGELYSVSSIPNGALGKFAPLTHAELAAINAAKAAAISGTDDVQEAAKEPTREEIRAAADELGIKYPANISDAKLQLLIAEANAAKQAD